MIFQFYSLCIPVSGFLRGIVYDLQFNDFHFVPNNVSEIIQRNVLTTEEQLIIDDLITKRLIRRTDSNVESDILMNNSAQEYEHPDSITNAKVSISERNKDLYKIFSVLNAVACRHVQFIIEDFKRPSETWFTDFMFLVKESDIEHLELVMSYDSLTLTELEEIIKTVELRQLFLYSSPAKFDEQRVLSKNCFIRYSKNEFKLSDQIPSSPRDFNVNPLLFAEAQSFNVYYNRKLIIDSNGDFSNGVGEDDSFGNIHDDCLDLKHILSSSRFQSKWSIMKDQTFVCQDCEFRYMCVDSRVPRWNNASELWYNEIECNYNPYLGKWKGESNYRTLGETGVRMNNDGIQVDLFMLTNILKELYAGIDLEM